MNEIEVVRVMRWWIAKSPKRRRMAMEVGGFDEVVQEAYLRMLRGAKPKRKYMMTTIATNQVNWAIGKLWMKKNRDIIEKVINEERMHILKFLDIQEKVS